MLTPNISKEALFEELGYKPHSEEQWSIHNSAARFLIPCCGRRFGKSLVAGRELTWRMFAPEAYLWIVGTTYPIGEKEFRVVYNDIVRKLRIKGVKKSYNVKQGDMRITMPWNTVLEVKSAEKQDGLLGEGLDYVCVSEAARHLPSTWEQYLEPALSDKRGGAIFPSTPKGANWYKGLYNMGRPDNEFSDYASWRFPTWFNKAMYPKGFKQDCLNIDPDTGTHGDPKMCGCEPELVRIFNTVTRHYWDQEYGAEFTSREGKIYPDWDDETMVIRHKYNPLWPNYLTFDFGFSDPFVCYDIQVDAMDNVYIWREYQVRHKTTWEHAQYLKNRVNPEGYSVRWAAADPKGADEIATLQMVMGIPILAHSIGWSLGIEAVGRWMKKQADGRSKFFVDRSCTELRRQIAELQTPELKEGKNAREGQKDYDDHGPDAVRYFFNEWQVLGAGQNLSDVYGGENGYRKGDGGGWFTVDSQITLGSGIGYK